MITYNASTLSNFFPARKFEFISWWERELLQNVANLGGFYNAHAHLCRAGTLLPGYLSHIGTTPLEASSLPLSVKQDLVGDLHRGDAYTEKDLFERMSHEVERQIAFGTRRLDTNIDATPDLPDGGMFAITVAKKVSALYESQIKIRIAPTPIFGFKKGTERWGTFKNVAPYCDFLSGLPEKDDYSGLREQNGKVGFRDALKRVLELGCDLVKEVQFHLDQTNSPFEKGTEVLLEALRWIGQPNLNTKEPSVWVVHMISPSSYDENRFRKVVEGLLEYNVGVIVCPSAALSMRQLRPLVVPTHNSLARVLELIKMKVPIRMGTDNIADVFVPQSDGDMLTEVKIASNAVRLASPSIWAKLATGTSLNNVDIASCGRVLYEDRKAFNTVAPEDWKFAFE